MELACRYPSPVFGSQMKARFSWAVHVRAWRTHAREWGLESAMMRLGFFSNGWIYEWITALYPFAFLLKMGTFSYV